MAIWYSLWSFSILFPFWYVWTKKNLAALVFRAIMMAAGASLRKGRECFFLSAVCQLVSRAAKREGNLPFPGFLRRQKFIFAAACATACATAAG
jgi:hypothetical protein